MGGKPGKAALLGLTGTPRFHFCPECPEDERGNFRPMKPTMLWPGKSIIFKCENGHTVPKGKTLLR